MVEPVNRHVVLSEFQQEAQAACKLAFRNEHVIVSESCSGGVP